MVSVVGDVEGGAIAVAGFGRGVYIDATKSFYVLFGAQDAADQNLVHGDTLHVERIQIVACNGFEGNGGSWYEVRYAAAHARVYLIIRVGTYEYQFAFPLFRLYAVSHGLDPPPFRALGMSVLRVRKCSAERWDGVDGMGDPHSSFQ